MHDLEVDSSQHLRSLLNLPAWSQPLIAALVLHPASGPESVVELLPRTKLSQMLYDQIVNCLPQLPRFKPFTTQTEFCPLILRN